VSELHDVLNGIVRHLTVRQELKDELHDAIRALETAESPAPAKSAGKSSEAKVGAGAEA